MDIFIINMAAAPRGRPPATTSIVDANERIRIQDIRNEIWRFGELYIELNTKDNAIRWCARHRLVKNTMPCTQCNALCTFNRHANSLDGWRWRCQACRVGVTVRKNSFFSRSHLTLQEIVIIIYCWAHDTPQLTLMHETQISKHTAIDWSNFMREECDNWLQRNASELGGLDANGQQIVVEIDESKYFHRKYDRGTWREGHWVFGGIERESGKCFMVVVQDRAAATLEQLIEEHILPGTHIMSDGWRGYRNVSLLRNGVYDHSVVIHERYFVDPIDRENHTQNCENMWMRAKRKLKRQFGTSDALFPSYLQEFVYRSYYTGQDLFANFLATLFENYI